MAPSTITAERGAKIRERFTRLADEAEPKVAELRAAGQTDLADGLAAQVASWRRMAAKRYESMPVVGRI